LARGKVFRDCPVENISCNDAQEYVKRLAQRTGQRYMLPSEAQWEYAARARTTTPFHTGATITTAQANFDGNHTYNGSAKGEYRKQTVAVGSFGADAFGLYDVHGNV
jgi:formylglycine-generating enzyme required for sulfatase activity